MGYIPGVTRTEVVGQQRGQQRPLKRHATDNLLNAENLGKPLKMLKNSLNPAKH